MAGVMRDEEYVLILGSFLFFFLSAFVVIFITLYRKARLQYTVQKQHFRQEILKAEIEIRENTLSDLGRELHDNLGQIASLVRFNLAGLIERDSENKAVETSLGLMDELIREMRTLSHALSDGANLFKGLTAEIEKDLNRLAHVNGLEVVWMNNANGNTSDPGIEILLYRIFQEALTNALKHADASRIEIQLEVKNQIISLSIRDNGKGLSHSNLTNSKGKGLQNMRSRIALLGGKVTIGNNKPTGTAIAIEVPKENKR
jgi:signal transduction histidine kinase